MVEGRNGGVYVISEQDIQAYKSQSDCKLINDYARKCHNASERHQNNMKLYQEMFPKATRSDKGQAREAYKLGDIN